MAFFIDSAHIGDVERAMQFGWVRGITTNPTLIQRTSRPADAVLKELSSTGLRPLYYQLNRQSNEELLVEAERAEELVGEGLVLKIPPIPAGYAFASDHQQRFQMCITAVFHPSQAAVAAAVGVASIAVYVNRATRLLGDGPELVRGCAEILEGTNTTILAASLKSPDEVVAALRAGAEHITAPLDVLAAMMEHDVSWEAVRQFETMGVGFPGH